MPELPEVEIVRLNLEQWALGRRIAWLELRRPGTLHTARRDAVDSSLLENTTITALLRRGKALWLETDGPCGLLMRFGMTGKWVPGRTPEPLPHARACLHLLPLGTEVSRLDFLDMRCFGSLTCLPSGRGEALLREEVPGVDVLLEPLSATLLQHLFGTLRTPIKVALLDQARLAGLGNIYASEGLYRAGISPLAPACTLDGAAWTRLAEVLPALLQTFLALERAEEVVYQGEAGAVNPFAVYGREGEPCGRCGNPIQRRVQAQRSTFWCGVCQPLPGVAE